MTVGTPVHRVAGQMDGHPAAAERRIGARIGRAGFNPQPKQLQLAGIELDVVVARQEHLQETAGRRADLARRVVAFGAVWPVGDQTPPDDALVANPAHLGPAAVQVEFAGVAFGVVATNTAPIEDGLDVARKIHYGGHVRDRLDPAGRPPHRRGHRAGRHRVRPHLVAADAADPLPPLDAAPALHALHRELAFVQCDKKTPAAARAPRIGPSHPVRPALCRGSAPA